MVDTRDAPREAPPEPPIRVLLVEDNPGDARLVREALSEAQDGDAFHLAHATSLREALEALRSAPPDVLLLDLSLPDSAYADTYQRVRTAAPDVPVVALSGTDDVAIAAETVRQGAQDYLVKGRADGELIARSLRYAIERRVAQRERDLRSAAETRRAAAEHALQEALREQEREAAALDLLATHQPDAASVTAGAFGMVPLRQALPEIFAELVQDYAGVLDLVLEQRAFRVEHPTSDRLRRLADRLGFLRAGPRDALDVHVAALRQCSDGAAAERVRAYMEEGRLTILELMGYLVSYYRRGRAA